MKRSLAIRRQKTCAASQARVRASPAHRLSARLLGPSAMAPLAIAASAVGALAIGRLAIADAVIRKLRAEVPASLLRWTSSNGATSLTLPRGFA